MLHFGKNSFGIDIGTQSIKIAEVKKQGKQYHVVNYVMWNDDSNEVVQDKSGEHNSSNNYIAEILQAMIEKAGMNPSEAYFSLPSYLAFSSLVTFPVMNAEELDASVRYEAKNHIPVSIDQVQVDWLNLGATSDGDKLNILIMALPNRVFSKYEQIAEKAGITIKGMELEIFSQLRVTDIPPKPTCMIDFGARNTTITLFDEKHQLFGFRSFDVGGNHITEKLAKMKSIPMNEAEHMKKQYGLTGEDKEVIRAIDTIIYPLLSKELGGMLKDYYDYHQTQIQNVVLLGGLSRMKNLRKYVYTRMVNYNSNISSISVSVGNPSGDLTVNKELSDKFTNQVWRDLSLALGVAIK